MTSNRSTDAINPAEAIAFSTYLNRFFVQFYLSPDALIRRSTDKNNRVFFFQILKIKMHIFGLAFLLVPLIIKPIFSIYEMECLPQTIALSMGENSYPDRWNHIAL